MITRNQFIARFNEIMRHHGAGCENDDHVLWEAEKISSSRVTCNWFVCVEPLDFHLMEISKSDYWTWVANTLEGEVVCFSSDSINKEEWWGFTKKKDVTVWLLKWSK